MLSLGASQGSPQGSPSSFRKWVKPAVFACLALLVVVAIVLLGGEAGFAAFGPWANLEKLVQENLVLSLAVYFLCTVVGCTVLVLPGMVFALAAGALFGPVLGMIAYVAAVAVVGTAVVLKRRFGLEDAISSNDGEGGE